MMGHYEIDESNSRRELWSELNSRVVCQHEKFEVLIKVNFLVSNLDQSSASFFGHFSI